LFSRKVQARKEEQAVGKIQKDMRAFYTPTSCSACPVIILVMVIGVAKPAIYIIIHQETARIYIPQLISVQPVQPVSQSVSSFTRTEYGRENRCVDSVQVLTPNWIEIRRLKPAQEIKQVVHRKCSRREREGRRRGPSINQWVRVSKRRRG